MAVVVPFLALAARALAWSPSGKLLGDQAVMDLQVRQALKFRLLLGVYDRFGWHHPGPVYMYAVAFFERLSGVHDGARAQVASAALINGLAAAGVVVVVGRRHGRRAALGAAAAVAGAAALLGSISLADPWTPRIVILPLVLFGVLTADAMAGSRTALLGSALVGSAAVQTDISTAPLVAACLLAAGVAVLWGSRTSLSRGSAGPRAPGTGPGEPRTGPGEPRTDASPERRAGRRAAATARRLVPAALLGSCILMWLPVVVQQIGGRPGNLSLLWRFFTGPGRGPDIGLTGGLSVLGTASAAVFGLPTPGLDFDPTPGLVHFSLIATLLVGLTVATVAFRSQAKTMMAASLVGFGAAVVAADQVTGMPWEYLLAWSAAPVALGLVAAGIVAAERTENHVRVAVPVVAAVAVVVLAVVACRTPLPAYTSRDVTVATDAVLAGHEPGQTVGLIAYGLQPLSDEEGVADQLVHQGVRYTVPAPARYQFPFSVNGTPTEWAAFTAPGAPVPPGYRTVTTTAGLAVSIGTTPPRGW